MPDNFTADFTNSDSELVFDPKMLDSLRELGGDDVNDFIDGLINDYLSELSTWLQSIRDAATQGNPETLFRLAHRLKGVSSSIGAVEVAKICEKLETLGRSGSVEGATALIPLLENACARIAPVLEAIRTA